MHKVIVYFALLVIIACFKLICCNVTIDECTPNPCGECGICVVNRNIRCIRAPCPRFECRHNDSCNSTASSNGTPKQEICLLPMVSGNCQAYFPKWFYNDTSKKCENFVYGGCGGNENKFSTIMECERICIHGRECPMVKLRAPPEGCRYDKSPGPDGCPTNNLICDVKSGSCPRFSNKTRSDACMIECSNDADCERSHKCCKIGCNNFCLSPVNIDNQSGAEVDDVTHSKKADVLPKAKICLPPKEYGKCTQNVERFYFNQDTKDCENFTYSGCGGNSNRFTTEDECERICIAGKECSQLRNVPAPDGCRFEEDSGEDGCPVRNMICDVKPGICPNTWNISSETCSTECSNDNDCSGISKCCKIECNSLCLEPEIQSPPPPPMSKPGSCPIVVSDPSTTGRCSKTCFIDDDCKGDNKCCSNGCGGFNCFTPIKQAVCNMACIIGKECAIVNGTARCVDKACNLACVNGKMCSIVNGRAQCVDNVTTSCKLDCAVGKMCVIVNGKPQCVDKEKSANTNCTFLPLPMPPVGCHYDVKTGSDGCPVYELACNNSDPCASNPCKANERCRIAPCFVEPCTEYECLPMRRSPECENNTCLPCQTCVRTPLVCLNLACKPYRCQNACGECSECGQNGVCVQTLAVDNTTCPKDLCQHRQCHKYPNAKCFVDKCNCHRHLYRVSETKIVTQAECEDI